MSRFINERKNNWQRLEDLLSILDVSSLRGLSRAEVREFGELYRRCRGGSGNRPRRNARPATHQLLK